MGDKSYVQFRVQGRFLDFDPNEGCFKYFHLISTEGTLRLKLAKPLRFLVGPKLKAGDWVEVSGEKVIKPFKGEVKWQAWTLDVIPEPADAPISADRPLTLDSNSKQVKRGQCVQICQKSDCQKRGSDQLLAKLQELLAEHPHQDQIRIQPIGCMKRCEVGPNLVFMPDRARYSQLKPHDLAELVTKHFPVSEP